MTAKTGTAKRKAKSAASLAVANRNVKAKSALGPTVQERMAMGKALRDRVGRGEHAKWKVTAHRPAVIALLKKADAGRVETLLPIRYGRMRQSPFAFYRGAAMLMAADLSGTPSTKVRVQACGD